VPMSYPANQAAQTAPAQQAPLTSAQIAQAQSDWPAVKAKLLAEGGHTWQSGPFARGYEPIAAGTLTQSQELRLGRQDNSAFTVWVVRGVFADSGGTSPPGASTQAAASPRARGLWFVVGSDGAIGMTADYPAPGSDPETTGVVPTPREDLNLS